ncbi:hypothetical protein OPV22_012156 [Ensete ventricosum]|uniref:Uncharacterized protein n=1 Tax=Ensete ventricosum TaxID=4639 RepID=A0AAV8R5G6_ENSVE|nr:hypothetical protein OPV22_012156 [Ensete ventricosum]
MMDRKSGGGLRGRGLPGAPLRRSCPSSPRPRGSSLTLVLWVVFLEIGIFGLDGDACFCSRSLATSRGVSSPFSNTCLGLTIAAGCVFMVTRSVTSERLFVWMMIWPNSEAACV